MEPLIQDVRYALRTLRHNLGFTAAALLALALGIGANTAIFSVVYSILLKPLPYHDPERLVVTLHEGRAPVSPADFFDYKREAHAFEQMAAAQAASGTIMVRDRAENVKAIAMSANMISLLGVSPLLGRGFATGEDKPGAPPVVLLSYGLWQRAFGGDPRAVGRDLRIDRVPFTVIGVMPPSFRFAPFWVTDAEMWMPLDLSSRINDRDGRSLRVFARLKPGVSVSQAQAGMDLVARRLADRYPQTNAKLGISVVPLHEKVVGSVRPMLLVLLGTVVLVLLIACANVANLMLTRGVARRKEIALRMAVGATRGRLVRQLITESVLLSTLGCGLGMLLAREGLTVLDAFLPAGSLPRQEEVGLDAPVFAFAMLLAVLTGVLSGLAPALLFSREGLTDDLKRRGSGGRAHGFLVGAEVSLALVLLTGAGLMIRTLEQLSAVDAGFDPHNLLTFEVSVAGTAHDANGKRALLFQRVADELTAIPDVESVSAINHLPIGGDLWTLGYKVTGRPDPAPGEGFGAAYRVVRTGYFNTMRLPLLRGRDFTARDNEPAPPVVIVNEAMANRQWPGANPVGQRITMGMGNVTMTVVGVAKNARQSDWVGDIGDEMYLPYLQRPELFDYLSFVVRARSDPEGLRGAVERSIAAVDPALPVSRAASMERVVAEKLWRSRLAALLLGVFAGVALALAAIGIYGVVSYSVRRRTQEIGIRMALGAARGHVLRITLLKGMRPVLLGAAAGIPLAAAASRGMGSLLYRVPSTDPWTFAAVTALLVMVAAAANTLPALRASNVDPLLALRHE